MDPSSLKTHIRTLIGPTVNRLGFDLVAVEWVGNTRGPVLRLSIERPGGVRASDCALVTKQVSPLLDEDDPIPHAYHLEVSSPGIERPVQRPEDFARFEGYKAKVRMVEGHPRRRFTGELGGIDDDEVLIRVDGKDHRLPIQEIERAHLVLTLDEYQRLDETGSGGAHGDDQ